MEREEGRVVAGSRRPDGPYWIGWVVPSPGDVIFLILFLFLVLGGSDLLADADTAWHIKIGGDILETGSIPGTGLYSYTAANMPWMSHEWLAEVIFAAVHKATGLNGIVVLAAMAIAVTHSIFFGFLISRGVNLALALVLTVFVITVTSSHWLARPHILSMPIILLWYMALERYRLERKLYLYGLPALTAIWVNFHGGFMAGLLILATYWSGSLLDCLLSRDKNEMEKGRKDFMLYSKVGLLSIAAALLNPHGYKALLFPFRVMEQKLSVGRISEWLSPNFHEVIPYEYMLLFLIVVLGFSLWRLSFIEAGLVILWVHLSLHSVRYGPIFAIIVVPVAAVRLERLMKEGMEKGNRFMDKIYAVSQRVQETSRRLKAYVLPIIAVTVAVAVTINGGRVLGKPILDHDFDKKRFPVEAVEFAEKNAIQGRVFNTYGFGSYLIYRGFPKEGVFVDGRADMYNEFLKNYYEVADLKPGWKEVLTRFDIDWFLISAGSPLSILLLEAEGWHLIYADTVANIFVREGPLNEILTNKYKEIKLLTAEGK